MWMWITCGLLWCFYQLFRLSFWRHPFTAEHPLLSKRCNATFLQIRSHEETSWMAWGWVNLQQIFIFGQTIPLRTCHSKMIDSFLKTGGNLIIEPVDGEGERTGRGKEIERGMFFLLTTVMSSSSGLRGSCLRAEASQTDRQRQVDNNGTSNSLLQRQASPLRNAGGKTQKNEGKRVRCEKTVEKQP